MKKIVKPHKARKAPPSTDVPSFARGKDQILKNPTRLLRRKKNELGEFDDGKNLEFREVPQWLYVDDGSGNLGIVDTDTGQTGTLALPELTVSTPRPIYAPKPWQYSSAFDGDALGIKKIIHNIGAIARVPMRLFSNTGTESEVIDLNNNVVRVDPYTTNLSTILTNDFVENNPNNIRYAKDFINTKDTLIGDHKIPLSKISQFYGVENGNLKIGSPNDFNPYTTIVPVRNKNVGRIYGIEEGRDNPLYEKYSSQYTLLNNELDNYLKDNFGLLSNEEYRKQYNKVNIPVIGSLLSSIFPTKARKLFENQRNATEKYNKSLDSNAKIATKIKRMNEELRSLRDSVNKYSPELKFVTDNGYVPVNTADFSGPGNKKTLFVSPTGEGSFFVHNILEAVKNPKIRRELDKRFKSNTLYPVKVDNGRYSHYQTSSPSYNSYTAVDFMRDPKNMFVIGTTKQPVKHTDTTLLSFDKGKDSGIHIKKANRGKFTAAAKRAGMGVQAYARKILSAPKGKYSPQLRRRANFARNASKFKH